MAGSKPKSKAKSSKKKSPATSNPKKRKASRVASGKAKRTKRNSTSKIASTKKLSGRKSSTKKPTSKNIKNDSFKKPAAKRKLIQRKPTQKTKTVKKPAKKKPPTKKAAVKKGDPKKAAVEKADSKKAEEGEKKRRSTRKRAQVSRLADQLTTKLRQPKEKKTRRTSAMIAEKAVIQPSAPKPQRRKSRKPVESDANASDDSSDSEENWRKREERRLGKRRGSVGLLGGPGPEEDGRKKPVSADITQMEIDTSVDWSQVGGLKGHVQKLQEMILLPMLYPENFQQFKIQPPRGVIFHGPPGTGKTLVARVLAAEASRNGKKVAFYMRKGADCLSKWVGEAERQLRLLFSEAYKNQPSIIFFDEIDGLAPVRSARQDQIHSSIVSTLLALMDGLDKRGQIIIIGATNRIDSIDPALRRPGRFDRELVFNLPSRKARRQILDIHTRNWDPPIEASLLDELALKTVGYCGADIEGLCREAFLHCFRRTYPRIYDDNVKLKLRRKLIVKKEDFFKAFAEVVPSSKRSNVVFAKPIEPYLKPLLQEPFEKIVDIQKRTFPLGAITKSSLANLELTENSDNENNSHLEKDSTAPITPRLLIHGMPGLGQKHLGPAVLHNLEEFPMYSIDLSSILGDSTARTPAEALFSKVKEARRNAPSILYWPRIDSWWHSLDVPTVRSLVELLEDIPDELPVYIIATSETPRKNLDISAQEIFPLTLSHELRLPSEKERDAFWHSLEAKCNQEPISRQCIRVSDTASSPTSLSAPNSPMPLPKEEAPIDARLTQEQSDFRSLRTYLRTCCTNLIKHFPKFYKKIDGDVNQYISTETSLQDIREGVNDSSEPMTISMFLDQIDELVKQVHDSYDEYDVGDKQDPPDAIREYHNEVCHLNDCALSMMQKFDQKCADRCVIAAKRLKESKMKEDSEADLEDKVVPPPKRKKPIKKAAPKRKKSPPGVRTRAKARQIAAKNNIPPALNILPDSSNVIKINEDKLRQFLDKVSESTREFNIRQLQLWYAEFNSVLYLYSDRLDRTDLLEPLEHTLQTLCAAQAYGERNQ